MSIDQAAQPRQNLVGHKRWHSLNEASLARLQVEYANLVAQNYACGLGSRATQGNGKTGGAGKTSALSDRTNQWRSESVESRWGHNQYESGASLLTTE